jgi:hypothetical protein
MRFVVQVITVGGGLAGFLGASCPLSVYSGSVVSVFMCSSSERCEEVMI